MVRIEEEGEDGEDGEKAEKTEMSVRSSLRLTHPTHNIRAYTGKGSSNSLCSLLHLCSLLSLFFSYEVAQYNGAEVSPKEIDESGFGADH